MIVAAILAAWFVVTIAYQFGLLKTLLGRYDYMRLIPRWSFFAPNPGHHDYHLVYRDRLADDSRSEWREVTVLNCGHNFSCLWNPQRRVTKTLSDFIQVICAMRTTVGVPRESLKFTLAYLMLLHVAQSSSPAAGVERQFAIARTHGFDDERQPTAVNLVFLSDFHEIAPLSV